MQSIFHVPGTILSTLPIFFKVFTIILWDRYYNYSHYGSQDLDPYRLDLESMLSFATLNCLFSRFPEILAFDCLICKLFFSTKLFILCLSVEYAVSLYCLYFVGSRVGGLFVFLLLVPSLNTGTYWIYV